jgi:putative addiction module killer protein
MIRNRTSRLFFVFLDLGMMMKRKLTTTIRAKISARLTMVRIGNFGDSKSIQGMKGIYELRIHFRSGFRVYKRSYSFF